MDLSQAELGALVGLTSQQVARWEKGESEISGAADVVLRLFFIEHVGGKINMRDLVEKLNEMDSSINEKFLFEKTAKGWEPRAA